MTGYLVLQLLLQALHRQALRPQVNTSCRPWEGLCFSGYSRSTVRNDLVTRVVIYSLLSGPDLSSLQRACVCAIPGSLLCSFHVNQLTKSVLRAIYLLISIYGIHRPLAPVAVSENNGKISNLTGCVLLQLRPPPALLCRSRLVMVTSLSTPAAVLM